MLEERILLNKLDLRLFTVVAAVLVAAPVLAVAPVPIAVPATTLVV
jgi:hypothetical protein